MKPAALWRSSFSLVIWSVAIFFLSGCATLMNGTTQSITVRTEPAGADCTVGPYRTVAPGAVLVQRNADYYEVACKKDGYLETSTRLQSRQSGWLWGNIFNGLLPGVVVDTLTGGQLYFPDSVALKLTPATAHAP